MEISFFNFHFWVFSTADGVKLNFSHKAKEEEKFTPFSLKHDKHVRTICLSHLKLSIHSFSHYMKRNITQEPQGYLFIWEQSGWDDRREYRESRCMLTNNQIQKYHYSLFVSQPPILTLLLLYTSYIVGASEIDV